MFDYREHIDLDPQISGGSPVFKGTRVLLRSVLLDLAAGIEPEAIRKEYPTISDEHIRAAIAFAADPQQWMTSR